MNSSLHIPMETILRQMDLWYRTPLGACLLEAEQTTLAPYLENHFSQYLLQIGGPSEVFLFPPQLTSHHVRVSPERMPVFKGPSVRTSFEKLPFLPETIDVILLPHLLEFVPNPKVILAQSHIALAPEGHLIIFGFNPWSLWGLFKCCTHPKTLPWRGQFMSMLHIKKLLEQQGFIIEETHTLLFRPPFQNAEKLHRWMTLEALGRLLWAGNGAVYCIVAKKRVAPLIPIQESLRYASPIA